jgi:hypothetical protein
MGKHINELIRKTYRLTPSGPRSVEDGDVRKAYTKRVPSESRITLKGWLLLLCLMVTRSENDKDAKDSTPIFNVC